MMSKVEGRKKVEEDSGNKKLLKEIETISKALYSEKNHPRTSIPAPNFRSKSGKFPPVDSKPKLRNVNEDLSNKEKKSIWNWKPLKAFSNIKNRKFNCCFSLVVHSIEGFPRSFEDLHVSVHWKRRDGELVTKPVKVSEGVAEFEEKLTHTCMVYGSRSGAHHSAKYEAKHFLLFASAIGYRELDLGKHRVDLTRLLPLTLEELEEEKSSGNWTTSFKLSGEAKGASLNVSFGYTVVGESPVSHGNNQNDPEGYNVKKSNSRTTTSVTKPGLADGKSRMRRTGSLPGTLDKQISSPSRTQSTVDGRDPPEVLQKSRSELASSQPFLFPRIDEHKVDSSLDCKPELGPLSKASHANVENACEESESSATEQRVESSQIEKEKPVEAVEVSLVENNINGGFQVGSEKGAQLGLHDVVHGSHEDDLVEEDSNFDEQDICSKESVMKALEDALITVTNLEAEALTSPEDEEKQMEVEIDHEINENETSLSLDDVTESVANEFLDMLGIEHSPLGLSSESEPESPRERLLRQFEKDALDGGYSLFEFDIGSEDQIEYDHNSSAVSEWGNLSEDFELSSVIQAVEEEYQMGNQAEIGKTRAKVLEDLETEALMREWGLNDKAFQCSPPKGSGAFGCPIDLPPEEPLELPPLGEGLGPFLQTKNGGFLRSMNPSLFRSAKTGGSLIMQVSSPVVVPAEMGSGTAAILQQLASVGIEKLSMQANKLMPLDDITGKTMQQLAWEEATSLEGLESQGFLQHEVEIGQDKSGGQKNVKEYSPPRSDNFKSNKVGNVIGSEYVSLEDLAPLAMDKIEALSMEGLRVQSGMSNEDASANINAQSAGEISGFQGKSVNISGSLGLDGAAGLQLLDIKDDGGDIEGLMGLSLTLDEWMRLDSGDIGDEAQISEQTSKILAAHHASSLDMIRGGSKGERRRGKGSGKKCGLLGNNFTVALMVQLHDPLRNYEPVGAPMLALIQVERVFIPPKPKIYCKVSEVRIDDEDDDESESVKKVKVNEEKIGGKASEDEGTPQFCITEVQVAGLKTEPSKNKIWGNTAQQQSGSRWLLANGMGKTNKNSFVKSKGISDKPATSLLTKAQRGDKLWSVSSRIRGKGAK
ncbi:protein PLASTID MOVEMENT IMPAIRED 1-RELATED 1 [Euphorbia lathyris]|uniref:protein PLASTID MOVEMENT IMPAIRED 1-RELATED 1 n=1 Tax=Euphorbia lathyris TaxID=212925 RepID=UPI003313CCFA